MRCHTILFYALLAAIPARPAGAQKILFGFVNKNAEYPVQVSVEGAAARLARAPCQDLFAEFSDGAGRPLSTVLASMGKSPLEAFGSLRFVDERNTAQCRTGYTLAFTRPGSPIIRICSPQFNSRFASDRRGAEIVLIHEFLHSLGLGENPPTSQEITQRVAAKCAV